MLNKEESKNSRLKSNIAFVPSRSAAAKAPSEGVAITTGVKGNLQPGALHNNNEYLLEECKKQIEMSMDYFNGSKKPAKRNALKSTNLSAKFMTSNIRSRNEGKGTKIMCRKYNTNKRESTTRRELKLEVSQKDHGTSGLNFGNPSLSLNSEGTCDFGARLSSANTSSKPARQQAVKRDNLKTKVIVLGKENKQKNSNLNLRNQSRNSVGSMSLNNNLSSTGAYNSITKNSRDEDRSSLSNTNNRELKNATLRAKPIFQICETGASIERFSKISQDNKDMSFSYNALSNSGYGDEEVNQEVFINDALHHKVGDKRYTHELVSLAQIVNANPADILNGESAKSSISESAVSEGSLVVQNLPTSKIQFATKKTI